ncbi:MAG: hypothetical protein WBF71_10655 [Microthrixaceae bacterium]
MTYRLWQRLALGYLALNSLVVGLWAQLAPRSFYDDFPGLGAVWVAVDGPYNEHLIRDVGGLNLALSAVLIAALVTLSAQLVGAAAVAALVYGFPHLVYHLFNTDGLRTGDVIASIGGLTLFVLLGVSLLLVTRATTRGATRGR